MPIHLCMPVNYIHCQISISMPHSGYMLYMYLVNNIYKEPKPQHLDELAASVIMLSNDPVYIRGNGSRIIDY